MYSGTPVVTNQGAETDRWAIIATGGDTFACYSERLGKLASGSTDEDFAPLNPVTGAPYFTLLAANWAAGLPYGSVFRFNTTGACAPLWVIRALQPSVASGTVQAGLDLIGSTD